MFYVLIEQDLEEEDEPRHIYAELDSSRREVRREESDLEREAAELERRVEEDLLGGSKKDQSPPPGSGR